MNSPHHELGDFLRHAHAARDPHTAALPADGRARRVPGLRREEVALLAGVSTDYYTRLEQGRHIVSSAQVREALATALGLDTAGRRYLRTLIDASGRPRRGRPTVQRVRPGIHQLLASISAQPALVLGHRTDVLASNALGRALFTDFEAMPAPERNYARWMLLDGRARDLFLDWEEHARNAVEALRLDAGAAPDEPGIRKLVDELSRASSQFRTWWSGHGVHQRTHGTKRLHHPVVGRLDVHFETLTLPDEDRQTLYVYTAEAGSVSEQALNLLASWTRPAPAPARAGSRSRSR